MGLWWDRLGNKRDGFKHESKTLGYRNPLHVQHLFYLCSLTLQFLCTINWRQSSFIVENNLDNSFFSFIKIILLLPNRSIKLKHPLNPSKHSLYPLLTNHRLNPTKHNGNPILMFLVKNRQMNKKNFINDNMLFFWRG